MKMRLAISGAGFIANTHAIAIQNSGRAELVAVVAHHPKKAEEFAWNHGVKRAFWCIEDLLKECDVDGIIIAVPNALHAPQTLMALRAGLAVMVEKPMAMNAREAEKMMNTSEQTGSPLMVGQCWRFDEEVNWLKQQVKKGKLGQVIRTKGYGVHINWGPEGWFKQKKLAGGGALVDMGVHALDTARYIMDDPQPMSVYARIGAYYIRGDVDDTAVMMVNWDNDAVSYIEAGWWQPHMDGPESATQVYGRKGFGSVFPTKMEIPNKVNHEVDILDPGYTYPRAEHFPQKMYDRQIFAFIRAIETHKNPKPGGMDGLMNMKVLDAAYQSAKTGKSVEIKI